jgi:hypothetical protein
MFAGVAGKGRRQDCLSLLAADSHEPAGVANVSSALALGHANIAGGAMVNVDVETGEVIEQPITVECFCDTDQEKAAKLLDQLSNLTPRVKRAYVKNLALERWTLLSNKTLLGKSKIPDELAEVVALAINRLVARGDVPAGSRFMALEYWAANTLAEAD